MMLPVGFRASAPSALLEEEAGSEPEPAMGFKSIKGNPRSRKNARTTSVSPALARMAGPGNILLTVTMLRLNPSGAPIVRLNSRLNVTTSSRLSLKNVQKTRANKPCRQQSASIRLKN